MELKGTGVALITPFTADNQVDVPALERIVEYVIAGGVEFIVALGTTSEAPTLTKEEKQLVCNTIVRVNNKRVPLVIGIGGNNTKNVIDEIKHTQLDDFVAILSVTPYYNKPSQAGMYAHFAAIAQASPLPIILYNVPGRTGVSMTAETIVSLATNFSNITAVKEASGNLVFDMQLLKQLPAGFTFLSGDDGTTLPSVYMEANQLHYGLLPKIGLAFKEGNPIGIKAILAAKGLCEPYVRLPLVEASAELKKEVAANVQF